MPDSPRKRMHKRTHSDEYITGLLGSDPKRNRNVEWLNTPYLLPAYIFFIALFYGAVRGTELVDAGGAWAFTNAVHGGLTFVVLHWWKVRGASPARGGGGLRNAGWNRSARAVRLRYRHVARARARDLAGGCDVQGSPDEFSQGEFNGQTLWEQIDGAVPSSQTKCARAPVEEDRGEKVRDLTLRARARARAPGTCCCSCRPCSCSSRPSRPTTRSPSSRSTSWRGRCSASSPSCR